MTETELIANDRRLRIIQVLAELPGYMTNLSLLKDLLDLCGHWVSSEKLREDLAWLVAADLVQLRDTGVTELAELTGRGLDVATDRVIVQGVKRPEPGTIGKQSMLKRESDERQEQTGATSPAG
ncbi:MAG: ArsR family transcriptional regulator [Rhodocyclaceae bacterium]|nr:ArsR family transcriptional regulator [Rhodocyclaceae bacterium]